MIDDSREIISTKVSLIPEEREEDIGLKQKEKRQVYLTKRQLVDELKKRGYPTISHWDPTSLSAMASLFTDTPSIDIDNGSQMVTQLQNRIEEKEKEIITLATLTSGLF